MKSSVEAGSTKTVTITFYPPKDGSTQQVYEADTNVSDLSNLHDKRIIYVIFHSSLPQLTLKGDCTQVQRLLLRGLVCE